MKNFLLHALFAAFIGLPIAATAHADAAPPCCFPGCGRPGPVRVVDFCTIERQQKKDEVCMVCSGSGFDACKQQAEKDGYSLRCTNNYYMQELGQLNQYTKGVFCKNSTLP